MGENLGPTNEFPDGKINENDMGELRLGIGTTNDNVVIDFGTSLTWLAFSKQEAIEFARIITEKANLL